MFVEHQDSKPDAPQTHDFTNKKLETKKESLDHIVDHNATLDSLSTEVIEKSLLLWIKDLQDNIPKKRLQTLMIQVNCFVDSQGVIRCKGRLEHSVLPYKTKFPILIDGHHPLTNLLIHQAHVCAKHQRTKATLAILRTQYWLPKGRSIVKAFIFRCFLCKYFDSQHYNYPVAPALPPERVTLTFPFNNIGVDYMGPLFVKDTV